MTDLNFINVDAYKVLEGMINKFNLNTEEELYPGDERRMLLQNLLPVVSDYINDSAVQNLLRCASGEVLDTIGNLRNVTRIPAQYSSVTLEFSLSSVQTVPVTILKGTRCTTDGNLFFLTSAELVIPARQLSATVKAQAVEKGTDYNWISVGMINKIADPAQSAVSVRNTTVSSGGANVEDDDSFRVRIRGALESYSVAGPKDAYACMAKVADDTIIDVSVSTPSAGVVKIVPLLKGGNVPGQPVLDKVNAVVNSKDKRPLTDNVQVTAPSVRTYDIDFTYCIPLSRQSDETAIRNEIEGTGGVVDQFRFLQASKLGKSINPEQLRLMVLAAGALKVAVNFPVYTTLDTNEVAKTGNIKVTYGGLV